MSDLTREAAQTDEALRAMVAAINAGCRDRTTEGTFYVDPEVAIAAFLASPPDWLTALVRVTHNGDCYYADDPTPVHHGVCADIPPSLRSAAGLDTP